MNKICDNFFFVSKWGLFGVFAIFKVSKCISWWTLLDRDGGSDFLDCWNSGIKGCLYITRIIWEQVLSVGMTWAGQKDPPTCDNLIPEPMWNRVKYRTYAINGTLAWGLLFSKEPTSKAAINSESSKNCMNVSNQLRHVFSSFNDQSKLMLRLKSISFLLKQGFLIVRISSNPRILRFFFFFSSSTPILKKCQLDLVISRLFQVENFEHFLFGIS